jgi:hypothetical protein
VTLAWCDKFGFACSAHFAMAARTNTHGAPIAKSMTKPSLHPSDSGKLTTSVDCGQDCRPQDIAVSKYVCLIGPRHAQASCPRQATSRLPSFTVSTRFLAVGENLLQLTVVQSYLIWKVWTPLGGCVNRTRLWDTAMATLRCYCFCI